VRDAERLAPGPRVSIVIPTKDGAETLPRLLVALEEQDASFDHEIVAIDSGSKDGSVEILREHGARVESIPPSDFDHGGTRNSAIRQTRGELIALLTQDAVPLGKSFLEALARPFDDARVAGVYGRQVPRPDCDVLTRRHLESWLTGRREPARVERGEWPLESRSPAERYKLCVFDNVCSAIRRSVWEEYPFPLTFFGEDIAWGKRVIEAGWAIVYEPGAVVEHSHRRSIFEEYKRTRMCHQRLHELFNLATLPRRRDIPRAVLSNWVRDVPYVLRHAPTALERVRQLVRVAGLSVLSPLAQNRGIRNAQRVAEQERCS
jgi:rhamnosyltransferase